VIYIPARDCTPDKGDPALTGTSDRRFRGASHVVSTQSGDTTVLMDARRSIYYTLDAVGSRIWHLLAYGSTVRETASCLIDEFDVAPVQVLSDVMATRDRLLANRLIVASAGSADMSRPATPQPLAATKNASTHIRVPSVPRCAWILLRIKVSLSVLGFERTIGWIARRVRDTSPNAQAATETVEHAERAVALAGAFYPGRARCLEQSMALYYLLRGQGVPLQYCHGVQCHPFRAHAWVEFNGVVVNDVAEHVAHFCRFPDQLP